MSLNFTTPPTPMRSVQFTSCSACNIPSNKRLAWYWSEGLSGLMSFLCVRENREEGGRRREEEEREGRRGEEGIGGGRGEEGEGRERGGRRGEEGEGGGRGRRKREEEEGGGRGTITITTKPCGAKIHSHSDIHQGLLTTAGTLSSAPGSAAPRWGSAPRTGVSAARGQAPSSAAPPATETWLQDVGWTLHTTHVGNTR